MITFDRGFDSTTLLSLAKLSAVAAAFRPTEVKKRLKSSATVFGSLL